MGIAQILSSIDRQLAQLRQARALLGDETAAPKKANKPVKTAKAKKRVLSAEGRRRIAEAQKMRWAARRKTVDGQK
jgi:chorismate mutase